MNNKGQSLVLFVLLMPIILGIIVLVVDVGKSLVEKNSINNKIELVMEYGLEDNLILVSSKFAIIKAKTKTETKILIKHIVFNKKFDFFFIRHFWDRKTISAPLFSRNL